MARHKHTWSPWSDPAREPAASVVYTQRRYCADEACNMYDIRQVWP